MGRKILVFDARKVKDGIVQWIRDYFEENGKDCKAVIGISGGKDSTIVAALCVEALGKDRVFGVLMPDVKQHDIGVSYTVCKTLGIDDVEINIGQVTHNLYSELGRKGLELNAVVTSNTPARIRMATLYAVSAIVGGRVANTSNLSEDWIGWATKFGDTAGDFSPLSNLTVTEVKAVGRELGLSDELVDKVPHDGLCGNTDEESFGFTYAVLDRYIREGICEDVEVKEKIVRMHMYNQHKLKPMPSYRL
jgi:NAD+ synthase